MDDRNDLSNFTDYLDYANTCANIVAHGVALICGVRHLIRIIVASYMKKKRKEL